MKWLAVLALSSCMALSAVEAQQEWTAERLPFAISDEETLANPRTLAVLKDGSVAIIESAEQQVHIVTAAGKPVRVFGRKGRGPGEFVDANGLVALPDGGLLVVDQQNARITRYGADGGLIGSLPTYNSSYGWVWGGVLLNDGRVAYLESDPPASGDDEPQAVVALLDVKSKQYTKQSLSACGSSLRLESLTFGSEKGPRTSTLVPFSPRPVKGLDPSGGVWCGHSSRYELQRVPIAGMAAARSVRSRSPKMVVPASQRNEAIKGLQELARKVGSNFTEESRIPKLRPFFEALTVDDRGRLWVMRPEQTSVTFDIFAAGESPVAHLRLPVRLAAYDPRVIKDGILTTFAYDEDDVKSVVRFRIKER